ncbi:organic cation transporter-like protein [Morone saxatilis]|uniref:organic cation transporter-like protein n=1 Tax=Morone saxatilis TaxID=34816 RepID=UPI0015E1BBF1|nr:organic cation transporter-like protein [Morone saxatilis]
MCVCVCLRQSVCGWTDRLSYGQTLFMVGMLLGSLVGGALSDRYGKRPVLLVCVCVHAVCGLVPAVLPHPILFLAVRCLTGVCCCCINICSFSLAVEWTPPAARLWPPAFLPFCFSLGTMGGREREFKSAYIRFSRASDAVRRERGVLGQSDARCGTSQWKADQQRALPVRDGEDWGSRRRRAERTMLIKNAESNASADRAAG